MLLVHLVAGFVLAIASAIWGWSAGLPFWALPGLYALGGTTGLLVSAAVQFARLSWHRGPAAIEQEA